LHVEWEGEEARLSIPSPIDEDNFTDLAPNFMRMDANGRVKPVNYELKHAEAEKDSPL
jgi:hypothetical protein